MHSIKLIICLTVFYMYISIVNSEKVPVTVYYESLCPDSKKFIKSQLYPALLNRNISDLVELTLVPFGLGSKQRVDDNSWQFQCHHGPYECIGNTIQACAIKEIEKVSPTPAGKGFNPITVAFINCLMDQVVNITEPNRDPKFDFPIKNCSEINNVPNALTIENCRNHPDGANYLAELGEVTEKLQLPLKNVPTIVFNGVYKKEDSQNAETNFIKVLCTYIKDKPYECNSSTMAYASINVLLLLLIKQFI